MSGWRNSTRRSRLPRSWPSVRAGVLERDGYRCTWIEHGERCERVATDVDHIVNGDDHSDQNLRSLCRPHHRAKSSSEGGRAAAAKQPKRRRDPEPHPGLIGQRVSGRPGRSAR
ncbi:HNH endonuclease [Nocardiopsis gilva YIM 90087]|nr:HNH endonuclease [Nocardiopsis gilva YIM 90087]